MNKIETFEEFLARQTPHIGIVDFSISLLITLVLGLILAYVYVRHGTAISNRQMFARNLVIISMTTMLIISIVKSSLALSLGLVGALSIVRFRTPIKEPEELAYLFLSIAIGLGLGAGQRLVVVVGFILIMGVIWIRSYYKPSFEDRSMHLTVTSARPIEGLLDKIVSILNQQAASVRLHRLDENSEVFEGDFLVAFSDYDHFNDAKRQLREIDDSLNISFLDNRLW